MVLLFNNGFRTLTITTVGVLLSTTGGALSHITAWTTLMFWSGAGSWTGIWKFKLVIMLLMALFDAL